MTQLHGAQPPLAVMDHGARRGPFIRTLGCIALVLSNLASFGAAPLQPGSATCKPVVIERKTFDPAKPPPAITRHEAAVCVGNSKCEASFSSETLYKRKAAGGDGKTFEAAVKIPSAHVTVSMQIIVWLPENAPAWLKAHEEAHRKIFEKVYNDTQPAALAAAREAAGKTFVGTGPNALAAEKDALQQALNAINNYYTVHARAIWARVNNIYDELTAHGMRSAPNSKGFLDADEAIALAFDQYATENAATSQAAATRPAD